VLALATRVYLRCTRGALRFLINLLTYQKKERDHQILSSPSRSNMLNDNVISLLDKEISHSNLIADLVKMLMMEGLFVAFIILISHICNSYWY
jgi:hypothetical protein